MKNAARRKSVLPPAVGARRAARARTQAANTRAAHRVPGLRAALKHSLSCRLRASVGSLSGLCSIRVPRGNDPAAKNRRAHLSCLKFAAPEIRVCMRAGAQADGTRMRITLHCRAGFSYCSVRAILAFFRRREALRCARIEARAQRIMAHKCSVSRPRRRRSAAFLNAMVVFTAQQRKRTSIVAATAAATAASAAAIPPAAAAIPPAAAAASPAAAAAVASPAIAARPVTR